jgi:hypothetical protein
LSSELKNFQSALLVSNEIAFDYLRGGLLVENLVHPLMMIYQNTKFHGPTLRAASFAFTSEV